MATLALSASTTDRMHPWPFQPGSARSAVKQPPDRTIRGLGALGPLIIAENWNYRVGDTIGDLVVTKLKKPAGRCVYGVAGDPQAASTEVLRRDADVRWEELSDENRDSRPTDRSRCARRSSPLWDCGESYLTNALPGREGFRRTRAGSACTPRCGATRGTWPRQASRGRRSRPGGRSGRPGSTPPDAQT
jgi:hypothetical protein